MQSNHVLDLKNGSSNITATTSGKYDIEKVKAHAVDVYCKSCKEETGPQWKFGTLINAWEKVTGSRFAQIIPHCRIDDTTTKLGDRVNANAGTSLEGW
jgi:hypothetical protein